AASLVFPPSTPCQNTGPAAQLFSAAGPYLFLGPALHSLPVPASLVWAPGCDSWRFSSPVLCPQSLVISCTVSAVSGHLLYCVRSLWSSTVLCPQSLVISCTVSAVSGHLLYGVRSLWSSPVRCPQSLVISCTVSAVSGHLLYGVCSLWSSPVLCPQSLVISCTVSAVSGHLLYYVCSPLVQNIFFSCFSPL
ncbi:unnamed protein product, partial [Staurois parvus]